MCKASWCDGKHVVFGQVLADDLPHLVECEAVGSASGLPTHAVVVADCGQLAGDGLLPSALTAAAAAKDAAMVSTTGGHKGSNID